MSAQWLPAETVDCRYAVPLCSTMAQVDMVSKRYVHEDSSGWFLFGTLTLLKAKAGPMKTFSSSAYRPKVDAGPQQIQMTLNFGTETKMNQCGSKRSQEEELQ